MSKRIIPSNPLQFIQQCVRQRKIRWTYHVNMRLQDRGISREAILSALLSYEMIEEYPADKYFPSYLIYCKDLDQVFHVLFATDVADENVRVITASIPNLAEWDNDLKKRRNSA